MRLSSLQVSADGLIPVIIDHALSDAAERLTSVMKRQEEWYRRADKFIPVSSEEKNLLKRQVFCFSGRSSLKLNSVSRSRPCANIRKKRTGADEGGKN